MKRPSLSTRDGRALRLGAFIAAPLLVLQLVVKPVRQEMSRIRDELSAQRALLARELELAAAGPSAPAQLERAQRLLDDMEPLLFDAPDDVSGSAVLANYVSDQARRSEVLIQHLEARASQPLRDDVVALEVAIRAESDLEGVLSLLRRLEYGSRLVTVSSVQIEPQGGGEDGEPVAAVLFTSVIRGYMVLRGSSGRDSTTAVRAG